MPLSPSAPRLGDLERVVMDRLWDAAVGDDFAGTTVREIHQSIERDRDIAYTTVMTVLDRLAKKKLVTRERDGRAWRYAPAGSREEMTAETVRRTLDDLDVDDRRAALLHFLDGASSADIADLKAALAQVEARAQSPSPRSRLVRRG